MSPPDMAERCADVRARAMPRVGRGRCRPTSNPRTRRPSPWRRPTARRRLRPISKPAAELRRPPSGSALKSARNRTPNAAAKTTTLGTVPNRAPYKSGMRTNVTDTRDTARCSAFLWVVAHVSLMGGALRSAACSLTGQRQARRPTEAPGAGAAGPWRMCRAVGYPCARARRRAGSSHDS